MDGPIVNELLRYIGIGGGGIGGMVGVVLLWTHIRVKNNKEKINNLEKECNGFTETMNRHSVTLAKLCTGQDNMIKHQDHMTKKIDQLINIHMDGTK